jgi:hypothetical protein
MDWFLVLGLVRRFVGLLRVIRRIRGMGVRKEMGRGRMGMTFLLYNEW